MDALLSFTAGAFRISAIVFASENLSPPIAANENFFPYYTVAVPINRKLCLWRGTRVFSKYHKQTDNDRCDRWYHWIYFFHLHSSPDSFYISSNRWKRMRVYNKSACFYQGFRPCCWVDHGRSLFRFYLQPMLNYVLCRRLCRPLSSIGILFVNQRCIGSDLSLCFTNIFSDFVIY